MPGNAGKAKKRSLQEDKDNPCHNQGGCQQAGDAPPLQYVLACWGIVSRLRVLQHPQACCITPDHSFFLDTHVGQGLRTFGLQPSCSRCSTFGTLPFLQGHACPTRKTRAEMDSRPASAKQSAKTRSCACQTCGCQAHIMSM